LLEPGITIPTDATNVTVTSDGIVQARLSNRTDMTNIGTIQIATFANPGGMEAIGNNLLLATPSVAIPSWSRPGTREPEVSRKATWKARTCPRSRK